MSTSAAGSLPYLRVAAPHPFVPFPDADLALCIPERFERQVRAHADRLAVRSDDRRLTFDELNRAANRTARRMLSVLGAGAEPVALLFDHGASVLAAALAVLKTGKFYMALDAGYPRDRLALMLEDAGARLIVADRRNLALARELGGKGIEVLDFDGPAAGVPELDLGVYPPPEALALILYTSGSTGRPKGVMHTHQNVLADARNLTNEWSVSVHDRWLLHTSVSFANSVRTIYGSLLNGASVHLYDVRRQGLAGLADWVADNEITILRTVPTTFRDFAATLPEARRFPAVRVLSVGGEPVLRSDLDPFNRHFLPHCTLVHALGPTECLTVCWACIPHGTRIVESKLPIGYPLRDKDVLVLDEDGRVLGEGEAGELAVKSRYIATGYWRDPARTASVFRPDPSGGAGRVYLTGDLGMRLPGGCLVHIGRRDLLVKVRGFRIDMTEIEVALRDIEGIDDAVVVEREDRAGEKRLVAYVVRRATPGVTVSRIRQGLARALPDYMMPSAFVSMDALPKTPNGKTDRLGLPPPPRRRPELDVGFAPPVTPLDDALATIWAEVLELDQVGLHDDFFDLGGNSLIAARLSARVLRALGVDLGPAAVFEEPTVAGLAKLITR